MSLLLLFKSSASGGTTFAQSLDSTMGFWTGALVRQTFRAFVSTMGSWIGTLVGDFIAFLGLISAQERTLIVRLANRVLFVSGILRRYHTVRREDRIKNVG
jgi:hypothetical protein